MSPPEPASPGIFSRTNTAVQVERDPSAKMESIGDAIDPVSTEPKAVENKDGPDNKSSKRRLFGLGKKKEEDAKARNTQQGIPAISPVERPLSPPKSSSPEPAHGQYSHPYSPGAALFHHPPRPASPSSIFERSVQDPIDLPSEVAPAIPSHMKTEDLIPPALEASSLAITDDHLLPDEVEIVTHSQHLPAATTLAELSPSVLQSESHSSLSPQESHHESITAALHHHENDDTASTYGTLDPNDVRRLSFISFADVVHAEHAESGAKDSAHHLPLSTTSHIQAQRPNSPSKSPLSPPGLSRTAGVTTPPATSSGPGSAKGVDLSPARSLAGSPIASSPHQHGELTIETMSQALRQTASGDLNSARSHPTSAIEVEDGRPLR